jgi:hypothetical protein
MKLATRLKLVLRLKMSGAIPLLLHMRGHVQVHLYFMLQLLCERIRHKEQSNNKGVIENQAKSRMRGRARLKKEQRAEV